MPLAQPTRALLLRTPEEERNEFIYVTRSGNPKNANSFRREVWYPLIERLGMDWLDTHDLRKAYGSWLLIQSAADFQTVSKWMGHSNPSVTLSIYAKAFEETELAHKNDMGLAFPMK
jgi:integrase|tara:strand:- start:260 stop:610 length:351 start_codon:yes stop_codon:yes gene_type:complete